MEKLLKTQRSLEGLTLILEVIATGLSGEGDELVEVF